MILSKSFPVSCLKAEEAPPWQDWSNCGCRWSLDPGTFHFFFHLCEWIALLQKKMLHSFGSLPGFITPVRKTGARCVRKDSTQIYHLYQLYLLLTEGVKKVLFMITHALVTSDCGLLQCALLLLRTTWKLQLIQNATVDAVIGMLEYYPVVHMFQLV